MNIRLILFMTFLLLVNHSIYPQTQKVNIAYIANMGVLIETNDKTVIIDGFHRYYKPEYLFPDNTTLSDLIAGNYGSFNSIDVAMITHKHGDHFDPVAVKDFLLKNSKAIVIGSSQIREQISLEIDDNEASILDRVISVSYDMNKRSYNHNEIEVEVYRCDHVNASRHSQIQNLAYITKLDNFKVLHVGDTNWPESSKFFDTHNILALQVDLAILPYWMLLNTNASKYVSERISPKTLIATHIPPDFSKETELEIKKIFPESILFIDKHQSVVLE